MALSWLKKYLIEDSCHCPLLLDTPVTASGYLTNITCPIYGCTDLLACNYDSLANTDVNNCIYPTSSTTNVTECDMYSWNGQAYTTNGVYTFASTNSNGCDSIVTLNLTINQSDTSYTTIAGCDSLIWNATTYTSNGIYNWVGTNSVGCDSTATLNLTINTPTSSTTNDTACDSYLWNAQTITTSGSYNQTFTNASGCDSIATLNLTIDYTGFSYDTLSICNGESYIVLSSVYTTSGQYADSILNGVCWSIVNTTLTVGPSLTSSITQVGNVLESTVNGGFMPYSYLWNTLATTEDINITSSGVYWLVVTDSLSCPVDTAYYNGELHTGISDIGISDLKVYPNPSRDIFNIVFSSNTIQNLDVSVVNMLGEFILKDRLDDYIGEYTKQIDLTNNAKGIYFLEIETEVGVINKKLILQ